MVCLIMSKKINQITIFLILCGLCVGQYGRQVEHPLIQSMSYFPFSENSLLQKNDLTVSLNMYHSNIYMFDYDKTVINDMAMFSNTLAVRYGLFESLTIELYYRFLVINGGFMDKFIMKFHDTFNLPDNHRDEYPTNIIQYKYKDLFFYEKEVIKPSPLVIAAAADIFSSEYFHFRGRLGLGLPLLPGMGFSSDKPFLITGLILQYERGIFSLDLSGYLSFFKTPTWLEGEAVRNNILTSEIELGVKGFFVGFVFRTTPFKEGDLANNGSQLVLGCKLGKGIELAVIEDLPRYDTTPDLSFNLKINLLKR